MFHGFTHLFQTWLTPTQPSRRDEKRYRILIPVSGGPHAAAALGILPGLASPEHEIVFLHVRRPGTKPARELLERVMDTVRGLAHAEATEIVSDDPFGELIDATAGFDLVVLGASGDPGHPVSDPRLLDLVRRSACPAIVVRRESGSRRVTRDGPRALVVAESSPAGMLGLERALRWAKAGSAAQEILLTPAAPEARERDPERRKLDLRRYGTQSVRVTKKPLGAFELLGEIASNPRDLVVLACDPNALLDGERTPDIVAERAGCSVVCVFASSTGPRTRRHPIALTV